MAFELFVNGTLMRGLALHINMAGTTFLGEFKTAPYYRVHSIADIHPGMYRLGEGEAGGMAIAGELYLVDDMTWDRIEAGEPPNLYRGRVLLEDGREVLGILYPRDMAEGHYPDISAYGGWREYMETKQAKADGEYSSQS